MEYSKNKVRNLSLVTNVVKFTNISECYVISQILTHSKRLVIILQTFV